MDIDPPTSGGSHPSHPQKNLMNEAILLNRFLAGRYCQSTGEDLWWNSECKSCGSAHCHCVRCLELHHGWKKRRESSIRGHAVHSARARKYGGVIGCSALQYWIWQESHWQDACAECAEPSECTDHVTPLFRGGPHSIGNLQRLCTACNSRKCAWLPGEERSYPWMKRHGL